jgi:NADH:ubiquinone oxidoreductase subunit K
MSKKAASTGRAKAFPGQHDDEEVLLVFRQHPLVMRKELILGLLAILVVIIPFDFAFVLAHPTLESIAGKLLVFVPIIVLLVWVYTWIGWYYSVYIVTGQRIIEIRQKGLFNRRVSEWRLAMVQNLNYHIKGFDAVIFGYGDITAQTFSGDLLMRTIHKPVQIHTRLIELVHAAGGGSTPRMVSGSINETGV